MVIDHAPVDAPPPTFAPPFSWMGNGLADWQAVRSVPALAVATGAMVTEKGVPVPLQPPALTDMVPL